MPLDAADGVPARIAAPALAGTLLAGAGLALLITGMSAPSRPPTAPTWTASQPADSADIADGADGADGVRDRPEPRHAVAPVPSSLPRARPVWLRIPRIGVDTLVTDLGLNPDGSLQMPPAAARAPAGWYTGLASPGEAGPAVIAGHVDSASDGPAVFFRLGSLRPGDTIDVGRDDGLVAHFEVTTVFSVPKSRFPSSAVYGPSAEPALRLVTCGGEFDPASGHYLDSVIVLARYTGAAAA